MKFWTYIILLFISAVSIFTCNHQVEKRKEVEATIEEKYKTEIDKLKLKIQLDSLNYLDSLIEYKKNILISNNEENKKSYIRVISELPTYSDVTKDSLWSEELSRQDSLLW